MTLGDTSIAVSKTVKSLGVTLDEIMSFNSHVDNICKAAHFHIRALRHIRRCIDDETARTVACSMVSARLDYCNSILYGTSAGNLGKLQRVINTLARVVSGTRKRDHITPILVELHWLPIASRIRFKVALQTYKQSPRRNRNISPIYSISRLHRDPSGHAQRTVFMLTLPGLASLVALFVMRRRLFGTLSLYT